MTSAFVTMALAMGPLLFSFGAAVKIIASRPVRSMIVPRAAPDPGNTTEAPAPRRVTGSRLWLVAGLGSALVISPLGSGVLAAGWYSLSIARRRRLARGENLERVSSLGEVVDLFAITLSSGGTISSAIEQGGRWAPSPYNGAFQWCSRQADLGRPLAEVLEDLPKRLGDGVRPLVAALVAHDRYGAPIGQNLARIATDARADRRRRAEAMARRLPITMLFPLVLCVLPAFLVLTVVPVVADTVSDFDFLASP